MTQVLHVRKRALTIQGVFLDPQMTSVDFYDAAEWCSGTVASDGDGPTGVVLDTLDGNTATVHRGWWILKGVAGEFYPCAPQVFDDTYDIVEEHRPEDGDVLFVRGLLPVADLPDWFFNEDATLTGRAREALFGSEYEKGVPNFSALEEPMAWVLASDEVDRVVEAPETESVQIVDLDGSVVQAEIGPVASPPYPPGAASVTGISVVQPDGTVATYTRSPSTAAVLPPADALAAAILDGNPTPGQVQGRLDASISLLREAVARARGGQA